MFNKMRVENQVQQNDDGKGTTKWWWKISFSKMIVEIKFNKLRVEKVQQNDGEKVMFNKMTEKNQVKHNDGGKLGYNKMMVNMYVQQNDG